jgi:hypothetical protein
LSLFQLLILECRDRQNVLEEIIQKNQGVELQVRVSAVAVFERSADALSNHLGDVEALLVDEVHLHHLEVLTASTRGEKIHVLISPSSSVRLGTTDVALNGKFIERFGTAVATEVGADDFQNLVAFQSQAGFTFVQELEQRLFESWVEDEGIEVIDVALVHEIESIYEKLQLVDEKLVEIMG